MKSRDFSFEIKDWFYLWISKKKNDFLNKIEIWYLFFMINFSLSVRFGVTLLYRIIPIIATQSVILGLETLPGNL